MGMLVLCYKWCMLDMVSLLCLVVLRGACVCHNSRVLLWNDINVWIILIKMGILMMQEVTGCISTTILSPLAKWVAG